jgi:NAD(P)-dependent dehydrogenase (short-subunit alcohol dehydrogenase family)
VVHATEQESGRAFAAQADIATESDILRLFEIADRAGRLCALVNNAATLETQMRLDFIDAARIQRIVATNVTGAMLCPREAVHRLSTHYGGTDGRIVNVSTGAARSGSPGEYVDYAASKGAIETFTVRRSIIRHRYDSGCLRRSLNRPKIRTARLV